MLSVQLISARLLKNLIEMKFSFQCFRACVIQCCYVVYFVNFVVFFSFHLNYMFGEQATISQNVSCHFVFMQIDVFFNTN